jgi:hypothetical protein
MKKIIILSVAFMMLAGTVFAQLGGVNEGFIRHSRSGYGNQLTGDGSSAGNTLRLTIAGGNEDGTYTGFLRFDNAACYMAYVWWRPIPQVGIFLGRQNDGIFETANIVAHNFSSGSYNAVTIEDYNYHSNSWGAAWKPGSIGYAIELKPVDGLTARIATSHAGADDMGIKDRYKNNIYTQVVYSGGDIGQVALTYTSARDGGSDDHLGFSYYNNSLVENLGFEVGFSYNGLDGKGAYGLKKSDGSIDVKVAMAGFGIVYWGEGWAFKTRGQGIFTDLQALRFTLDFLHTYDLEIFEFRLFFRTQFYDKWQNNAEKTLAFCFNPYVIKRLGPGRVSAGVRFLSKGFNNSANSGVVTNASYSISF